MAYPIIENPIGNEVYVYASWTAGGVPAAAFLGDYVTEVRGSSGSRPDVFYAALQPGIVTISLYDVEDVAAISPGMKPGTLIGIGSADAGSPRLAFFQGYVRDVNVTYAWEVEKARFVPTTVLEVVDAVADLGNTIIPAKVFAPKTGQNYMTDNEAEDVFYAETGSTINIQANPLTTPYLGQFNRQVTALEFAELVARTHVERVIFDTVNGWQVAPCTAPTVFNAMITDGTDTSGFTGVKWGMTDIEYGYQSSDVITQLELTNQTILENPKVANDPALSETDVQYTSYQTVSGFNNKEQATTIATMELVGWNLLKNTGSSSVSPKEAWGVDYVAWGVSPTMTYNSHPVAAGTVTTAWSSRALPLMVLDVQDTFVSAWQGTGVGNWTFQFKSRTVTAPSHSMGARIVWYNSAGTVLRTDTGSFTNVANAAWVTHTLSVATPPTGAVTAVAYVVSNTAQAVGYQFYVTEAMFTRAGVSTTFFDGDTPGGAPDDYEWQGERGNSKSLKVLSGLPFIGSSWLAFNPLQKKAKSVTVNMQQPIAHDPFYTSNIDAAVGMLLGLVYNANATQSEGIKICLNGVEGNYRVVGCDFELSPSRFTSTLHVVKH